MWFQEVAEPQPYETLYDLYDEKDEPTASQSSRQGLSSQRVRESLPVEQVPERSQVERRAPDRPDEHHTSYLPERRATSQTHDAPPLASTGSHRPSGGGRVLSAFVGLFAAVAVVGSLTAGAWFFKPEIIELIPATEEFYAFLPSGPAATEFEFQNTAYTRTVEDGKSVLIVSGELVNVTDNLIRVPNIQATLKDFDNRDVDGWEFGLRRDELEPGEALYFESRRVNPPDNAYHLHLVVKED
jgi:hypothetical protein